jgi:hypothetical protein
MMANAKLPTDRSRHIDIQKCALQEWMAKGEVSMRHVRGTINPDYALTKALGLLLHHRHSAQVMGMRSSP